MGKPINSDASQSVVVGRIGAAHGIKGWIKIQSFTAEPAALFAYQPLWVLVAGKPQVLEIVNWRMQGKSFVAQLKGCNDRNDAQRLTQCEVLTDAERLPALDDDDVYWHQLMGKQVQTQTGELLGLVDHLLETGSNDVMVVKPSQGSIDNRERLIPLLLSQGQTQISDEGNLVVDWDSDF